MSKAQTRRVLRHIIRSGLSRSEETPFRATLPDGYSLKVDGHIGDEDLVGDGWAREPVRGTTARGWRGWRRRYNWRFAPWIFILGLLRCWGRRSCTFRFCWCGCGRLGVGASLTFWRNMGVSFLRRVRCSSRASSRCCSFRGGGGGRRGPAGWRCRRRRKDHVRRSRAIQLCGVVPLRRRTHGDSYADLARLPGQHLRLALAGRRVSLLGAAAGALDRGVLPLALSALTPQLLPAFEAFYEPVVEYVLLRFPGVVLRLPPFPFHVVLHFVLKRDILTVNVLNLSLHGVHRGAVVARLNGGMHTKREGCT